MASTQLQRTAGTSTENYKYTFSAWVKRTGVLGSSSSNEVLFSNWYDSSNSAYIRFEDGDDNLHVYDKYGSTIDLNYKTNMKFRDRNSFYHIVVNVDGSRSANTRCKIYVNGSEVSCSSTTDTGGTLAMKTVTTTNAMRLGAIRTSGGAEYYFSGIMSHVHYIDGTGYDASYFGETDSTTGEWKIKTNVTGVTYGNNGFFILKDGNSVTDQSGEGNNFTVTAGTLTKTEDNPSNVFATLNPLIPMRGTPTYQSGNTYFRSDYSNWDSALSTIGATSGKYYFEAKWGGQENLMIGCVDIDKDPEFLSAQGTYGYLGYKGISYFGEASSPRVLRDNSDAYTGLTTFASGDIIGCAIDLDNQEMFVHRNGTYTNSGNPSTRANPYAFSTSINQGNYVLMGVSSRSGNGIEVNFGNGYFSSTAVSSAGTNASGIGIFEYDVPTGYTALSTKGLNL